MKIAALLHALLKSIQEWWVRRRLRQIPFCETIKTWTSRRHCLDSVLGEWILQRTSGRCRVSGRADHVDERSQSGGNLPTSRIVKNQPLEWRRPVFQYADQLARAQERLGQRFDGVRDP